MKALDQHSARSLRAADGVADACLATRCESGEAADAPGSCTHLIDVPGAMRSRPEHAPQNIRIVAGSIEN